MDRLFQISHQITYFLTHEIYLFSHTQLSFLYLIDKGYFHRKSSNKKQIFLKLFQILTLLVWVMRVLDFIYSILLKGFLDNEVSGDLLLIRHSTKLAFYIA